MRTLERAIDFCQSTLSYGRAQEAPPDRRMISLESLVDEVRDNLGLPGKTAASAGSSPIERGIEMDADHDQIFRVLLNLSRNAAQALEARAPNNPLRDQIRVTGRREGGVVVDRGIRCRSWLVIACQGASLRGVFRFDPPGRDRAWPCHRGGTHPRPWRRDPAGRGYHRRNVSPHPPGPGCRSRRLAGGAGKRLISQGTRSGYLQKASCHSGAGAIAIRPLRWPFQAPFGATCARNSAG